LVSHIVQVYKENGLPPNLPFFMTEGNLGGGNEVVDIAGALWLADYVGSIMSAGASGTFYFHYVPAPLRPRSECPNSGGTMSALLNIDQEYHFKGYFSQYFASQLITKEWVQPVDEPHQLFRATSEVKDVTGNVLVTAYAVKRPDGNWSVMLINKDRDNEHAANVVFEDSDAKRDRFFSGEVDQITFGAAEYQWHPNGTMGHADPDGPASRSRATAPADMLYHLPKASITILRGRVAGP
jgi:hypothetical protein